MAVNPAVIAPAAIAFFCAFLAVLLAGPRVIQALRILKFGQNINEDAPKSHQKKQGTPSIGGVLIILGTLVGLLITAIMQHHLSSSVVVVLLVFVAHACLGFIDDYRKAKRGKSLGLRAREKLAGQILIALLFTGWLYLTAGPYTTQITFGRDHIVNLGYLYYLLVPILMIGLSNATNLTDGLDGLASGLTILTSLGLAFTVFTVSSSLESLPWFGYALAGACLGFLWYNAHPARVFMGDTGSLALGSSLTAMAVLGKQEILFLLFSLVFLLETFSVMIQVSYFKWTKRRRSDGVGQRVFRKTPLHHHFEEAGWDEMQVVMRFWVLGALSLALGLWLSPTLSAWIQAG